MKNRSLEFLLQQKLEKQAALADSMTEGNTSIAGKPSHRQKMGEVWSEPDSGSLGSPPGSNLIESSDKQGHDSIYNGQLKVKDPQGKKLRDAIKEKIMQENSADVDSQIEQNVNEKREEK